MFGIALQKKTLLLAAVAGLALTTLSVSASADEKQMSAMPPLNVGQYMNENHVILKCAAGVMPLDPLTGEWKGDAKKHEMSKEDIETMKECLKKEGYFTKYLSQVDVEGTEGLKPLLMDRLGGGDGLTPEELQNIKVPSVTNAGSAATAPISAPTSAAPVAPAAPVVTPPAPPPVVKIEEPAASSAPAGATSGRKPGQLWVTPD